MEEMTGGFGFGSQSFGNRSNVRIKIIGIGGGGCNAVKRLKSLGVKGVTFVACNTDILALSNSDADVKIALGKETTKGMGAGSDPAVGERAARESIELLEDAIKDSDLVFLTAGMGGGTGTGGICVLAEIAKKYEILSIAVVTKPFKYEGDYKMRLAENTISKLRDMVDVLVVVPNELAFNHVDNDKPMYKVIQAADDILRDCILGVTSIVINHTLINLDFADIRTAVKGMKTAHIGVGKGTGKDKVMEAFQRAVNSDLLNTTIKGATNVIINMTGDMSVSAAEVGAALEAVKQAVDPNALIKHGLGFNSELHDQFNVTIVATGFKDPNFAEDRSDIMTEMPFADTVETLGNSVFEETKEESGFTGRMKVKEIPSFISRLKGKK